MAIIKLVKADFTHFISVVQTQINVIIRLNFVTKAPDSYPTRLNRKEYNEGGKNNE